MNIILLSASALLFWCIEETKVREIMHWSRKLQDVLCMWKNRRGAKIAAHDFFFLIAQKRKD